MLADEQYTELFGDVEMPEAIALHVCFLAAVSKKDKLVFCGPESSSLWLSCADMVQKRNCYPWPTICRSTICMMVLLIMQGNLRHILDAELLISLDGLNFGVKRSPSTVLFTEWEVRIFWELGDGSLVCSYCAHSSSILNIWVISSTGLEQIRVSYVKELDFSVELHTHAQVVGKKNSLLQLTEPQLTSCIVGQNTEKGGWDLIMDKRCSDFFKLLALLDGIWGAIRQATFHFITQQMLHVPWDLGPGGVCHRLGDKPNFKERGLLGTQVGHTMGRLSQTQHWPKPAQMEINKCSSIIVGRGEERGEDGTGRRLASARRSAAAAAAWVRAWILVEYLSPPPPPIPLASRVF